MGISKNLPLQHNKQLVTVDYCVSGSSSIGYIRYITDSNTLCENSDWIKDTHKQSILDEALHKQPNELLENNFTIYK